MAGGEENCTFIMILEGERVWYLSLICVLVLCVSFSNDGSNN